MLIKFTLENFASIKDAQQISMVATASSRNTHAFKTGRNKPSHLLRVGAIFGPNASGKTTLIRGINTLRRLVLTSGTSKQNPLKEIAFHRFDPQGSRKPIRLEIAFVSGGTLYEYAVALTSQRIVSEWLTQTRSTKSQLLVQRTIRDKKTNKYDIYLNPILTGKRSAWTRDLDASALLLSKIVLSKDNPLKAVHNWFRRELTPPIFRENASTIQSYSERRYFKGDAEYRELVLRLLRKLDPNIQGVLVSEQPLLESMPDMSTLLSPQALKRLQVTDDSTTLLTKVQHGLGDGDAEFIELELDRESDGTRRLFALIGPILFVLRKGGVLVVDELHNSLHPLATKFLVSLFQDPKNNPKNSQLIFSTHDPTMLRNGVLHRDQIWFMDRDANQASQLIALSEFKERADVDFETRYLAGRYGAIPAIYETLTGLWPEHVRREGRKFGRGKEKQRTMGESEPV